YAEQKIIQTDLKVSDILKTKTPIPDNFLKLEKPTCERFGFTYEEEWIQLDIPHTLMKELDLPLGEDIPYPVYISPQVLERKPICGGLTIENKKEIIIDKLSNKDQETQTNLTGQQILNQINQLQQEDNLNQQTIINLQGEIAELENKLTEIEGLK
ncbi:3532_t:CDS:2, partial [Racocetra persica]